MTRIRYKKENGTLVSNPFLAVSDLVTVTLFETNNTANFLSSGKIVKELKADNLPTLKKLVKNTLVDMGVVFQSEVRPRLTKAEAI